MCKDKEKCCQEAEDKRTCCSDNDDSCCGGQGKHDHKHKHDHHHHDHHGCGCGHDHDHKHHHHQETISLTTDDGEQIECTVLGTFDVKEKAYIALLPEDSEDVFIYAFSEDGDNIQLDRIESDEEYETVGAAFMALWDEDEEQ